MVGFGLATANLTVFRGAAELYATNFIAITLSAAVMARLYGFGQELSPRHTRAQALLILVVMAALAVPLGFALRQIAWEARASSLVRATLSKHFGPEARVSQLDLDFRAEPMAARAVVLTPRYRADSANLARAAAAAIGRPLTLRLGSIRSWSIRTSRGCSASRPRSPRRRRSRRRHPTTAARASSRAKSRRSPGARPKRC